MKKTTYAICGTAMVMTAVTLRTAAGGSLELLALLVLGVGLLIASAESPGGQPAHRKGAR